MKTILHIVPYSSTHLTLQLIKEFVNDFDVMGVRHEFVLYGDRDDDKDAKYDQLEKELSISLNYIESENDLSLYLKDKNNYSILIHGDSFLCIKQSVKVNNRVSWICWGYIPPKGNKLLLSNISFFLRKRVYKKLKNIVCLLSGDKKELLRLYQLTNIMVLPYSATENIEVLDKYDINRSNHKPLNVYIGNSGHNYQSYLEVLPSLAKYKGFIKVHIMFQYPDWPEKKELVKKMGHEIFGDDFVLDEKMMDIETYRNYMNQCDVYICGDKSQTGLGAIHFCLSVGTKVFLTGKNLEWEKELGANVFNVDDLKNMSFTDFSCNLLPEEKAHNRRVMIDLWDQKADWIDFLKNKC